MENEKKNWMEEYFKLRVENLRLKNKLNKERFENKKNIKECLYQKQLLVNKNIVLTKKFERMVS